MAWAGAGLAACLVGAGIGAEGFAQPGARTEPGGYEFRLIRLGEGWQAIRFDPSRGDAWQVDDDRWVRITDAVPPPAGRYDVLMTETGRADWAAIRVDRSSGRGWFASEGRWNEIMAP